MNAIELLTAFSGESETQYEEFFRFSEEARIVGVEIHAVGTESTTARYSGGEEASNEVNTILRFTTADGSEGISGMDSYFEGEFSVFLRAARERSGIPSPLSHRIDHRAVDPVDV